MRAPIILSGPSGSGKGTILKKAREQIDIALPISCTTRPPRPGEKDGVHYHFLRREDFVRKMSMEEFFIEYAENHGHLYGTPFSSLAVAEQAQGILCHEIEVKGAKQIKEKIPGTIVVFVSASSVDELERRIRNDPNRSHSEEDVQRRLRTTKWELGQLDIADYLIRNDNLEEAVEGFLALITELKADRVPSEVRFNNRSFRMLLEAASL